MAKYDDEPLEPGLYETVVDRGLAAKLTGVPQDIAAFKAVDTTDIPYVLAEHVRRRLTRVLEQTKDASAGLALVDTILDTIDGINPRKGDVSNLQLIQKSASHTASAQQLAEVRKLPGAHLTPRPQSPLTESVLLTNAKNDPNIQGELASEFLSADGVDVIIAFIKWAGIRVLENSLRNLHARGVPIRIITTTYMGVTEREALDRLVNDYGAHVRVNYASASTRLHAKAWLIKRRTGFHTAFVGSSNLSRSAMVDGLEWNVRLAANTAPAVFAKFESTFESYWESDEFEEYVPDRDGERLNQALQEATLSGSGATKSIDFSQLEVRPYPYQKRMLDDLARNRQHGHHRNLLVAATGTGKTVVAALDWRRLRDAFRKEHGRLPRTLFVAHRKEILAQAQRTFVDVVKESRLGLIPSQTGDPISSAILNNLPNHGNTLFASIQSLHANAIENIQADFFDFVIIDEFHHAEADSYRRLLDHLQPAELLGLTATPERADGVNVAIEFFGGRIASEMRLWEALEEDLLVPFHYFVNADDTDLSTLPLRGGEYLPSDLSKFFTGNDARTRKIIQAIRDKISRPEAMRAVCFCVDIKHAEYMADEFRKYGFRTQAVTSKTPSDKRISARDQLQRGELQVLCVVDIFNEGVDIPQIDTLIMLRPTQSSTVFLQQLGRGLRRAPGKAVLTVLDFVGNQNEDFRFDLKLRALTGKSGKQLQNTVEEGVASLPSGSQIVFDEYSQETVLRSIRQKLNVRFRDLVSDVRELATLNGKKASLADYQLAEYLHDSGFDFPDIYRRTKQTVHGKKRPATFGLLTALAQGKDQDEYFDDVRTRLHALGRVNDPVRAEAYARLLASTDQLRDLSPRDQALAHMLTYLFWPQGKRSGQKFASVDEALGLLRSIPNLSLEVAQIVNYQTETSEAFLHEPAWDVPSPLLVGGTYTREELLAALRVGWNLTGQAPGDMREGVHYCADLNVDALLITLVKNAKDYSPHTLYRDYALTPSKFHWESQSGTRAESPTGKRYRDGSSHIALFIREHKEDELGGGAAYTFAGPADLISSRGSQPMQVVWDLKHELPPELFLQARAVSG